MNPFFFSFFFFTDTATTEFYTLSLHDALPIYLSNPGNPIRTRSSSASTRPIGTKRSEEHTSELQSQFHLVCRLLLEKKKTKAKSNVKYMAVYFTYATRRSVRAGKVCGGCIVGS